MSPNKGHVNQRPNYFRRAVALGLHLPRGAGLKNFAGKRVIPRKEGDRIIQRVIGKPACMPTRLLPTAATRAAVAITGTLRPIQHGQHRVEALEDDLSRIAVLALL